MEEGRKEELEINTKGQSLLSRSEGKSSHSFRILYKLISEPGPGYPQFVAYSHVDDQLIGSFDSYTKSIRSPAMEKMISDIWVKLNSKEKFQNYPNILQKYDKQNGGSHILQCSLGCKVNEDRYEDSYFRCAYDGQDLTSLDTKTFTFKVFDAKAQGLKRKLEANLAFMKVILEKECPEWLKDFVTYGNETLMRKESPVVNVTHRTIDEAQESLICKVHGFYPKKTEVTLRRVEEVGKNRISNTNIAPNSDGTYHAWCHVDHANLPNTLFSSSVALGSNFWVILCVLFTVYVSWVILKLRDWIQKRHLIKAKPRKKKAI